MLATLLVLLRGEEGVIRRREVNTVGGRHNRTSCYEWGVRRVYLSIRLRGERGPWH